MGHIVKYTMKSAGIFQEIFSSLVKGKAMLEVCSLPLPLPLGLCYEGAVPGYVTAVSIQCGSKFCAQASVLMMGVRVWGPDDIFGLLTQFCLLCSASY